MWWYTKNRNRVKLGGYMEYRGGTSDQLWSTTNNTHASNPTTGGKDMQTWWNFCHNTSSCQYYPEQSKPPRLPSNGYKYSDPPNHKPLSLSESQLHVIDILVRLFNKIQTDKNQTKVVPREVPTIAPPRAPITIPPPGVTTKVTPQRVMTPRTPTVTQEDPIEYRKQRDTVENNNQHQLKQRYITRITQISQEINQVDSVETTSTIHQHWIINIHEQVKATP